MGSRGQRRESGDVNGKKGVAQCVGSLCVHALLSSLCISGDVDEKVWEGQREDKEEKERKSVLEKGEKEKQPLQKPKHTNQKNNSFLPFLLFSLQKQQNTQKHTKARK